MKKTLFLLVPLALLAACSTADKDTHTETKPATEMVEDTQTTETTEPEVAPEEETQPPVSAKTAELDALSAELDEMESQVANGTPEESLAVQTLMYERWEQAINKMYDELNAQKSEEEMAAFSVEQDYWAAERENQAIEESAEFEEEALELLHFQIAKTQLTKDRAYDIAEKYFN